MTSRHQDRLRRQLSCRLRLERLEDRAVPDSTPAAVLDPNLQVSTVVGSGITQPMGIVFLSANDFFVLEKASGQVKRVISGVIQPTPALDLAVNSASERGLLSMALHPNFPTTPFVYIRWTESSTGADTTATANVPLLGNRVDRFVWNGSTLTFDQSIIALRARQTDNVAVPGHAGTTNANENGNHNGGVIKFGPDGKLYIFMGDAGRRGYMQNLVDGPFLTAPQVDDTFGGPAPDNNHLTGVIIRLNDDGTTPTDNPFFAAGAALGGEVGANLQKIYSYGHRNGFGMAFDPISGSLWETENADDAYSELNRVVPGMNGGWIQFAGPLSRVADFKFIETTQFTRALQQVRFPPTRIAYTPALASSRMFMLPGAVYVDPDLSWRYEIGPAGTTFVAGNGLGAEYNGTLWMGSARSNQQVGGNGGSLYRMKLTSDRLHVDVSADPRLADRVADNLFTATKFDGTESETLKIGSGFGITPAIEQGPDGNLYVVSNTDNVIYKISRITPRPAPLPPGKTVGQEKLGGTLPLIPGVPTVDETAAVYFAADDDAIDAIPLLGISVLP
ncbi:MAG: PQQ-dependent sugar dehydrogenase [Gemmataceae bacterium]|nr:PQQ-dependent sugar dehydrogenase [Gemmataceae bacterium]